MKKENENKKTEFSISKINNIIGKLNKTGILIIVVLYIAVLGVILGFVGKDINYINTPNYQHEFYNDEITPQISMTGVRNFEEGGGQTLKYNVSVNIAGRLVNNVDPGYKISNFRMFANTKSKLEDKNVSGTYYFTEHNSYKTQVTHSFTVDNSEKGQHPAEFYVRLQYEKGDKTKVATFKETIFLQPTQMEKDKMNDWYLENLNNEDNATNEQKHPSAAAIYNDKDQKVGVFQVASYKETNEDNKETGIYKSGVRINLSELPEDVKKFHVDMQSWIITADDKYLPFIGVYNYTGHSKKYTNSYTNINSKLNPKFICAKVVFRDSEKGDETECYFKQEIDQIRETFSSTPEVGKDTDAGNTSNNKRVLYITLAATISVVLAVLIVVGAYIYTKKTNKKAEVKPEELDENKEENKEDNKQE